ncbi:ParB family chromosome partitioning protein [Bacilli bacterium PM5-9]|nr:ParB family chromosome partitioning protein [Bacilli bacterium PM5-9]
MKKDVIQIRIADITTNPHQPRKAFDEANISELAESIKTNGLIQPIVVRKKNDRYELVAGERRLRAMKQLNCEYIEAIVNDYDEQTSAKVAIIENIQRENLSAVEEAVAYEKLIHDHGYTQQELATSLGKSQSTIANKIRLLGLSEKVKESILNKEITERHGRALLKITNTEHQEKALDKIIKDNLNVDKTEKYVENITSTKVKPIRKEIISKVDYRLEINTIRQAAEMIKKTGALVELDVEELTNEVKINISIKK